MNNTALLKIEQEGLTELKQALRVPEVELSRLPAKLSKRLWVGPEEFLGGDLSPGSGPMGLSHQWRVASSFSRSQRATRTKAGV